LLDLDAGRYQAGWGRVRNALRQVNAVTTPPPYTVDQIDKLPKWNDDTDFPCFDDPNYEAGKGPVPSLEGRGVFFSA
ncbi:ATP-dependent endonuclease, partial [Klebsiella pneumoniae]|nr:ATP-dependent endonuclease [Klebsiella pneumoniae]